MPDWKIHTPEGVQDILFEECAKKRIIEEVTREVFNKRGFREAEPPIIEFFDVFNGNIGGMCQEAMFKFFDQQGRILVLRPDITTSIARIVSTKIDDVGCPLRFSYIGNVYRFDEQGSVGVKQREFTQAGVEIFGSYGPEADAEVLATVIETIRENGLQEFQIEIGQVEFFKGLMEEAGFKDEETEKIRTLIEYKDYFGIEAALKDKQISDKLKETIMRLPRMFGEISVIDEIYPTIDNERSKNALDNIREIFAIMEDYNFHKYIHIDLGLVHSINYYSGMVFKGLTLGLGFSICAGGRYDGLTEAFGKEIPATGGAVGINRLMIALDRQGIKVESPHFDTLVVYSKKTRKIAIQIAEELRKQGLVVELGFEENYSDNCIDKAKQKGIKGVIEVLDEGGIKLHDLIKNEFIETTIEEIKRK